MFCKSCGKELPDGAKFCGACGTSTAGQAAPQTEAAPVAPMETPVVETPVAETPVQETAPKGDIKQIVKERLLELVNIVKPYAQKFKLQLVGGAALVVWLMAIAIVVALFTAGNGYIAAENGFTASVLDDEVVVLWNNKVIETDIEADFLIKQSTNLDGTVFAGLTDNGILFVARKAKVAVVAEDVVYFNMSANGNGLAYVTEDGDDCELKLYSVKTKKSTMVDDEYSKYAATLFGMELSPDGKSLAYYELNEDGDATLMYFSGKKSIKITSNEVDLIGLSNGGKFIYVLSENDDGENVLNSYNTKGKRTKINTCSGTRFFFNDDHTQILFTNDGKTYISTKAKEAKKIVSGTARLLLTNDSNSFSGVFSSHATTYPVEDLYDHVYTVTSDGKTNLWHVKSAKKVIKLASNVYNYQLDADAEYVYYTNKSGDLSVLKISHGEKAADKAKELADEVERYVVTSNRKTVYYLSDDALYSCNAKNGRAKKEIASDDLGGGLVISAKNVVFYAYDGDLYACSNGRTGKKVLSDPIDLYQCENGVVYVMDEDSIYVTTGAAKLKKLMDND